MTFARRNPLLHRRAFTLLEILVVVIIIGMLVGLLLPAVQAAREQARMRACQNNLQQLWMGVYAYRQTYDVFPAGTMAMTLPVENFPADNHQGWILRIDPWLSGGTNRIRQFDHSLSVYAPQNWRVAAELPEMLQCPSTYDPEVNYVGIYDGRPLPIDDKSRGAFVANRFLQDKDFEDGMSMILMLGESSQSPTNLGWLSGTCTTLRSTGIRMQPDTSGWRDEPSDEGAFLPYGWLLGDYAQSHDEFVALALEAIDSEGVGTPVTPDRVSELAEIFRTRPSYFPWSNFFELQRAASGEDGTESTEEEYPDEEDMDQGMGYGMSDEWDFSPEITYPIPLVGPVRTAAFGLTSKHPAGVNVVFADGHVRHLNYTIDEITYAAMGIRNDGRPLTSDE